MSALWIPLMEAALRDLAHKQEREIATGSQCTMTEGPQVARFAGESGLDVLSYHANAALHSSIDPNRDERSFLLPSISPEEHLDSYSVVLDDVTGIFHVASRYRYMSFKELLELKDPVSPQRSRYIAEFSNGAINAVPRNKILATRRHHSYPQVMDSLSLVDGTPTETSHGSASAFSIETSSTQAESLPSPPSSASQIFKGTYHKRLGSLDDLSILPKSRKIMSYCLDDLTTEDQRKNIEIPDDTLSEIQYRTPKPPSLYSSLLIDEDGVIRESRPRTNCIVVAEESATENAEDLCEDGSLGTQKDLNKPQENGDEQTPQDPKITVIGTGVNAHVPFDRSVIRDMPCFSVYIDNLSQCCHALDLIQHQQQPCDDSTLALAHLDLAALSKQKERVHRMQDKCAVISKGYEDVDVRLGPTTGDIYWPVVLDSSVEEAHSQHVGTSGVPVGAIAEVALGVVRHNEVRSDITLEEQAPVGNADELRDETPQGITQEGGATVDKKSNSNLTLGDIDALLNSEDDDDEIESHLGEPTVLTLTDSPVFEIFASDKASSSLGLRPHLSVSTNIIIDEVHRNYCETWAQAHPGVAYDSAGYDEIAERLAIERFESNHGKLQTETIQVVQQFIAAFLKSWREGHPPRPDGRWISGEDDYKEVSAIAVELVEWEHMISASDELRGTVCLRPESVVSAESSSPLKWYLQETGDGQYSEYRLKEVEKPKTEENGPNGSLIHHINFNGYPVYERSYTPPEVSFWAAATTYSKVIFGNEKLSNVHYARVIASQAFKWVDPTQYVGENLNEVWQMTGSAMKDAATSDVKVVYQEIGTWNRDDFTEDDVIPGVAPADLKYEYAMNGSYHNFQVPYRFNIEDTENRMFHINGGRPSEHKFRVLDYDKKRRSRLRYELGTELAKKAALFEKRLEKHERPIHQVNVLEAVAEETPAVDEDRKNSDKINASEADTDVQTGYETERETMDYVNANDERTFGEAPSAEEHFPLGQDGTSLEPESGETDIEAMIKNPLAVIEWIKAQRSSRPFRSYDEDYEDGASSWESDKESFDGDNGITDHNSVWPEQRELTDHPKAEILLQYSDKGKAKVTKESIPDAKHESSFHDFNFSANAVVKALNKGKAKALRDPASDTDQEPIDHNLSVPMDARLTALEDGRYTSPSKMVLSRMDEIRTPLQSPTKVQDFGSWELDEFGNRATPGVTAAPQADDYSSPENVMFSADWEDVPSEVSLEDPFAIESPCESDDDVFALAPAESSEQTQAKWARGEIFDFPSSQLVPSTGIPPIRSANEGELQVVRSRVYTTPSVSPVPETDLDVDRSTPSRTSKELVLFKAPRFSKVRRSLSHGHRINIGFISDVKDLARSLSGIAMSNTSAESSKIHSRSSSSSGPLSILVSNNHSRSSSLSAPLSDEEIQEDLGLQAEAKQTGLAASVVANQPDSPTHKSITDIAHAVASLSRQPGSVQNVHAFRKEWMNADKFQSPSATDSDQSSICQNLVAGIRPEPSLSIGHYTLADIPPTKLSENTKSQQAMVLAAGDIVEVENGNEYDEQDMMLYLFGPVAAMGVGWVAWKMGKIFWRGLWA